MTANRGLAGAFNSNLIREARLLVARLEDAGTQVDLHMMGRKGIGFFKYVGRTMVAQRTDISDRPTAEDAASLVDAALTARPLAFDPWRAYGEADARFWPMLIAQLHAEMPITDAASQLVAQTRALVASLTRLTSDLEREPTRLIFGDQRQGYTPK